MRKWITSRKNFEIKCWLFEKFNKINPLIRIQERKHKLLLSGQQGDIRTEPTDIKRMIKEYYKLTLCQYIQQPR